MTLRDPSERKFDIEEVETTTPDLASRRAKTVKLKSGMLILEEIRLFKGEAELLRDFLTEMINDWEDSA